MITEFKGMVPYRDCLFERVKDLVISQIEGVRIPTLKSRLVAQKKHLLVYNFC